MMNWYHNERIMAMLTYMVGLFGLFLLISFGSYSPTDTSSFMWSTRTTPLANYAGIPGAYGAAFFFYLFGGAAWLIIPALFFVTYLIVSINDLSDEWERLASAIAFPFMMAGWLGVGAEGGGAFGFLIAGIARFFLRSSLLTNLFFATTIAGFILLITRCWYIVLLRQLVAGYHKAVALSIAYQVVPRSVHAAKVTSYYVLVCPLRSLASFITNGKAGRFFEGAPLLVPKQEEAQAFDLGDLYSLSRKEYQSYQPYQPYQPQPEQSVELKQSTYQLNKEERMRDAFDEREQSMQEQVAHHYQPVKASEIRQSSPMPEKPKVVRQKNDAYQLPANDLFPVIERHEQDEATKKLLELRARILEEKLERFGVHGKVVTIKSGPVVTLYEYEPQIDTKLSKILALEDDLALALQALSIRIIAPIPGTAVVGFEVANHLRTDVHFSKIITSPAWETFPGALPLILGEDTVGGDVIVDLARMPHLLVAGSTGSGKSVALNAMLMSLLCKRTPDELQLILIDPKRLEFAPFADIAHLLFPIVTEPKRAVPTLRWVIKEMEERYEKMAFYGARNIADYNQHVAEKLPYLVVVIDELADLMMTTGRDIEDLITRIAQMARASGIHMIVATQRPSVDVITGLIKVNFPSRISFRVTSKIDSRTILDVGGADKLVGRGDMLFLDSSAATLKRVHGAYVSNEEIMGVVHHIKQQQTVVYLDLQEELAGTNQQEQQMDEPLYDDVLAFLREVDDVSISLLQRKFRIGYNRSARIIELLEMQGLIMPNDSGKMRKVIRE